MIAIRGDNIQYVHTDSNHTDPLQRITPAKLISSKGYEEAVLSVLSVFGFNRSLWVIMWI
jgi:hypothetical protein